MNFADGGDYVYFTVIMCINLFREFCVTYISNTLGMDLDNIMMLLDYHTSVLAINNIQLNKKRSNQICT